LRPERFVTRKIIQAAIRISKGSTEKLHLGNVDIKRDWGWAPEYVIAMRSILQQDKPDDFVIATGRAVSLGYFAEQAFEFFGLDWMKHVEIDHALMRPSDIRIGAANPAKANEQLGWKARVTVEEVVVRIIADADAI
jgi:GDPmannose 4,6-dehydratase